MASIPTAETRTAKIVDAPSSVVFKALTDEKELVKWMPKEALGCE